METIGDAVKALKLYSYKAVPKGTSYKAIKLYNNNSETEEAKRAQRIAWKITEKLNAPNSYQFFLKCAWNLSENTIWDVVERSYSPKIKNKERWVISALHKELNR